MVNVVNVRPDRLSVNLRDCLTWCQRWKHARPPVERTREVFRSQQLAASANAVLPNSCHTVYGSATAVAFDDFLAARKKLAATVDHLPDHVLLAELIRPQALVVLDWSSSLFDGAATPETDGFLDFDYILPWDTWLILGEIEGAYTPRCLVGWVPGWLSEGMDSGIAVDPASCLSWCSMSTSGELLCRGWGKRWKEADLQSTENQPI